MCHCGPTIGAARARSRVHARAFGAEGERGEVGEREKDEKEDRTGWNVARTKALHKVLQEGGVSEAEGQVANHKEAKQFGIQFP